MIELVFEIWPTSRQFVLVAFLFFVVTAILEFIWLIVIIIFVVIVTVIAIQCITCKIPTRMEKKVFELR